MITGWSSIARGFLQANSGTRSNVLTPLLWLIGILTAGLVLMAWISPWAGFASIFGIITASQWVTFGLAVCLAFTVFVFLFVFTFLVVKSPDLLRSESFTIQKMAMEKGLIGDNNKGMIDPVSNSQLIEAPKDSEIMDKDDA